MEYHSMKELFAVADAEKCSPGIIACRVEAEESGKSYEEIWARMKYTIPIFRESIQKGLSDTSKSASGLVGGDANRLFTGHMRFISPLCQRAASYAIATAEANAKMYRIVACPTAGSCGIVPAVLSAVAEETNAAVDLLKGSTRQIGNAFALALKNILGLVCDPVGGLVEVPCVKRNAFHAVHALLAVEMAMNGIESVIPPDEVIEAMGDVGRRLPVELKETSRAGLAVTKTGRRINEEILKKSAMVK